MAKQNYLTDDHKKSIRAYLDDGVAPTESKVKVSRVVKCRFTEDGFTTKAIEEAVAYGAAYHGSSEHRQKYAVYHLED